MAKLYAGIGSRKTPPNILQLMENVSAALAKEKWCLRSGGAKGADSSFEFGCNKSNGKKEIFYAKDATSESLILAEKFHPNWARCSPYVKKLHARNGQICLGRFLDEPVKFIICWTPNAKIIGGTGQALRLAAEYKIKVYNLADDKIKAKIEKFVRKV